MNSDGQWCRLFRSKRDFSIQRGHNLISQIGQASIEAYLTAFKSADFNPLPIVAQSFPTAAPYFASYILLQTAIQPCFEIFRFGVR